MVRVYGMEGKLSPHLAVFLILICLAMDAFGWTATRMRKPKTGALVAWYKFDESSYNGTASQVIDASGNGLHGTSAGNATTSTDSKFDRAAALDGSGDWIEVPDDARLNFGTGNFSFGLWIKLVAGTNTRMPLGKISAATGGYGFYVTSAGRVRIRLAYDGGGDIDLNTSVAAVNDGNWHHLLATINRTGNAILYIDGSSANGSTTDISANAAATTSCTLPLRLGARNGATPLEMQGQIDDAAIWNRVLTPGEVTNVYEGQPY